MEVGVIQKIIKDMAGVRSHVALMNLQIFFFLKLMQKCWKIIKNNTHYGIMLIRFISVSVIICCFIDLDRKSFFFGSETNISHLNQAREKDK